MKKSGENSSYKQQDRLPYDLSLFSSKKESKLERSQAENYTDSFFKSFTRISLPDSKVFGFDVPPLNFRLKICGDTTKEGRFCFGFVYLFVDGKTNPALKRIESGTIFYQSEPTLRISLRGPMYIIKSIDET